VYVGAGQPHKKPAFIMKKIDEIQLNKQTLATACRLVRLENGLTAEEFAGRAGFSRQSVYNFESGKHVTLDLFLKYYALASENVSRETMGGVEK
jgi:DNA-binding XRE family transcriptional regulator